MKFSERLGFKPVRDQLQIDHVDVELRNGLWSVYLETFLNQISDYYFGRDRQFTRFARALWTEYFKNPIDTLVTDSSTGFVSKDWLTRLLRKYFFEERLWYEYYDLLEFTAAHASADFAIDINTVLEYEKSAYRFVNGQLAQITSNFEISEIEDALAAVDKFQPVNIHLNTGLKMLSDKKSPDYRNSIKESISAIEAMCKIFTNNPKATLGEALSKLEKENTLHPALKKSFSALYGYTSDEGGIRHALIEGDREIDFHEAKFILVTSSSFINYLISRQI